MANSCYSQSVSHVSFLRYPVNWYNETRGRGSLPPFYRLGDRGLGVPSGRGRVQSQWPVPHTALGQRRQFRVTCMPAQTWPSAWALGRCGVRGVAERPVLHRHWGKLPGSGRQCHPELNCASTLRTLTAREEGGRCRKSRVVSALPDLRPWSSARCGCPSE